MPTVKEHIAKLYPPEGTILETDTPKELSQKVNAWKDHLQKYPLTFKEHMAFVDWLKTYSGLDLAFLIDSEMDFVDLQTPTMRQRLWEVYLRRDR